MASLCDAIDTLEYLLTARLMPEDYSVEELVDALASGEDGDLGVEPGSVDLYTCIIYDMIMYVTVYINSQTICMISDVVIRAKYAVMNG